MPKIQFSELPRGIWHHLLQRVDERRISVNDLLALQAWVRTGPLAPEGDWHKDFGSFILCGSGRFPFESYEPYFADVTSILESS